MNRKQLIVALSFLFLIVQSVFAQESGTGAFNEFINNDTNGSSFKEAVVLLDICDYSKCKIKECLIDVFNKTVSMQELKYVADNYGQRSKDWNIAGFDEVNSYVFDNNKYYDDLGIEIMGTGENIVLHFDVTASVNVLEQQRFNY
ncbi:MAG: hypothetical protein KJ710_00490 [Candidatus Omnitrophica bacterium]|nr:hypothetical protein [Candidatus Omnitrophota bacterium]MBU1922730.1 hypothetical protein [Candidatus Omnitrophota bacterium]